MLEHPGGSVHIKAMPKGKNKVSVQLENNRLFMRRNEWTTSYSLELIEQILKARGPAALCDEIMRDEDPSYLEKKFKYTILSYEDINSRDAVKILDFGCGCGASTMVLSRMFPNAQIVGVELLPEHLKVAILRAKYYKTNNVTFIQSDDGYSLPSRIGDFDYAVLSAVFEHLLPEERRVLMPKI